MSSPARSSIHPAPVHDLAPIIAGSQVLRGAVSLAKRAASTQLPILLIAPTGSGKELFAQHIHRWSGRPGELVDVNCAALPESLMESELFGHGATAFTGARRAKPGLIEVAHGRSFFLDEISSLPVALQAKLLRVVEAQEVRRVGEVVKRQVDVRFIAAAQEDLLTRVATGTFRHDLYHRLAGVVIRIPALADRRTDILPLAAHFAHALGVQLAPGTEGAVLEYHWPGNARELRMVIERASCLAGQGVISANAIVEAITIGAVGSVPDFLTEQNEADDGNASGGRSARGNQELLGALLARHAGNVARAARTLDVPRTTLLRWLREAGLTGAGRPGRPRSSPAENRPLDSSQLSNGRP